MRCIHLWHKFLAQSIRLLFWCQQFCHIAIVVILLSAKWTKTKNKIMKSMHSVAKTIENLLHRFQTAIFDMNFSFYWLIFRALFQFLPCQYNFVTFERFSSLRSSQLQSFLLGIQWIICFKCTKSGLETQSLKAFSFER